MLWAINSGARHWRCINRVGRRAAEQRADQLWPKLTYYLYSGAPGVSPTLAPTAPKDLASPSVLGSPYSVHSDSHGINPAKVIVAALSSLPRRTQGPAVYRWVEELHIWRENTGQKSGWILFVRDAEGKHPTQTHTQTLRNHTGSWPYGQTCCTLTETVTALLATQIEWTGQKEAG